MNCCFYTDHTTCRSGGKKVLGPLERAIFGLCYANQLSVVASYLRELYQSSHLTHSKNANKMPRQFFSHPREIQRFRPGASVVTVSAHLLPRHERNTKHKLPGLQMVKTTQGFFFSDRVIKAPPAAFMSCTDVWLVWRLFLAPNTHRWWNQRGRTLSMVSSSSWSAQPHSRQTSAALQTCCWER